MRLSEEFAKYKKELEKRNLSLSFLDRVEQYYNITLKTETFEKLGRKNFPVKATKTEIDSIDARQFACYITSISFFKDRVYYDYTQLGYLPTRLSCISPNNETKITRSFKFELKQNA